MAENPQVGEGLWVGIGVLIVDRVVVRFRSRDRLKALLTRCSRLIGANCERKISQTHSRLAFENRGAVEPVWAVLLALLVVVVKLVGKRLRSC